MRISLVFGMTVALLAAPYTVASERAIDVAAPYSRAGEDFLPRHFTDAHPARNRFRIKRGLETPGPAGTRLSIRPMKGGALLLLSIDPNTLFLK